MQTKGLSKEVLMEKILLLRGQKVMLDRDLAALYGVETKRLTEQVRRNIDRFPDDFMFRLSDKEYKNLKSQNAASSWGGTRKLPLVFTEHGILMLSSVLRSKQAVQVNIEIMRMFSAMRIMLQEHHMLLQKLERLDTICGEHDEQLKEIWFTITQLMQEDASPQRPIGFQVS